jgi:predicted MFS family arabinose efflux permease
VLDLRLYRRRDFALGSTVIWVTSMVVFGSLILIPIFLEQVRQPHLSALDAGLALMPQGIAAAVAVALSGRLYKRRDFALGSVVIWVTSMVIFGSLLLIPIFLEQVRLPHLSALDAGLALMPQGLAAAVAVATGGRLYNRIGVRPLIIIGGICLAFSSWQLSQLTPATDGIAMMPWLAVRGLGFGFANIPVQTLALQQITGPALPRASSLFTVTRQIFSSIGVAVITTLFVQQTAQHAATLTATLPPGGTPDPTNPAFVAARDHLLAQAGTAAVNDVFVLVTIGTLAVIALAFVLPDNIRQPAARSTGEPATPPALSAE